MNVYSILNARIVADPFTKFDSNGKAYTEARVVDNPLHRQDKRGNERKGRFVTCKWFGGPAEKAAKLAKGDIIAVTGRLEIETYKSKDGAERDKDVLIVSDFAVAKSESFYAKADTPGPETEETPAASDEIPF